MPNLLDTLEALERQATPGPWEEHESPEEGFWIESANGGLVSTDTGLHIWPREADTNLMIAARNALPALLRMARAAREWEEAQRVYTGLFESSAYEGGMGGAERRLDQAEDDLRAALAALDAAGEGE